MKNWKRIGSYFLILLLLISTTIFLGGCEEESPSVNSSATKQQGDTKEDTIDEQGSYTSKEEVARYLHEYGKLPPNFITKDEAKALGWDNKKGDLWDVAQGKSIGGDRFGNREGLLPSAEGRQWYECDIDYQGGFRNEKRIVYSNDGLIYYTGDHYKNFEKLY